MSEGAIKAASFFIDEQEKEKISAAAQQKALLIDEINNVNLSYLLVAQRLLMHDFKGALLQLGLDERAGQKLLSLSVSQVTQLARIPALISAMRLTDADMLDRLSDEGVRQSVRQVQQAVALTQSADRSRFMGGE